MKILMPYVLEYRQELVGGVGAEHGYARLAEVGNALEDGGGGKVATCVEDAAVFIDAGDVYAELLLEDVELGIEGEGRLGDKIAENGGCGDVIAGGWGDVIPYLLENPGTTEGGTTNHDGIHTIAVEGLAGIIGGSDVTIADDGDVYAGVVFHFADEGPVGTASVHLGTGATMDGESCYTAVLQLFSKVGNDKLFGIPSQSGFHRDRYLDSLYHLACYFEHEGDVLQHTCTGSLSGNLLDGTSKVEIDDIRMYLFHNLCRLDHCRHVATIYLYADRPFVIADSELVDRSLH